MEVVICGGGIAGLTAALTFHGAGFKVRVFEAKENRQTTTSAIALAPSGVKILFDLGMGPAILEKSLPLRYLRMFNSQGDLLADVKTAGKEQYGNDSLAMTRRVLHNVLTSRVESMGIAVRYKAKVSLVEQSETRVKVFFEDGSSAEADILIGADGIHSKVRQSLFPELSVEKKDRGYSGCGVLAPLKLLSPEEQNELKLADGAFNTIKGPNGFVGFVGIGKPEDDGEPKFMFWTHIADELVDDDFDPKDLAIVKKVLLKLRAGWCRPIEKVIQMIDQSLPGVEVVCGPITSLWPIPAWSKSRVVLIGDAAHGYGPGGQGAALAMEDAQFLALLLKGKENQADQLSGVFQEFEKKRRVRVERIGDASEARNTSRLGEQGWMKSKIQEYAMMLMHWWYKNGYYNADYAYKVEDDM